MNTVYLSRKNLLDLLAKLDGVKEGFPSNCTIVKHDVKHPKYPCSDDTIITAVEDEEYYTHRNPGFVFTPSFHLEFNEAYKKYKETIREGQEDDPKGKVPT